MLMAHYHIEMLRLRRSELEQSARRYRASRREPTPLPAAQPVTMRIGTLPDGAALEQVAKRKLRRSPLAPPLLIGELAGRPVAAVSLINGAIAAERQYAAEDVVALLRLRALQLRRGHSRAGR
jgi:hypothetical protein